MKIRIRSLDSHSEEYDRNFEMVEIVSCDEKHEYHYEDEYGRCRIIVRRNDEIEIYRQGTVNSKQVFRLGKRTSFIYMTGNFKGKYEVFTKKRTVNDGKILLEYDIMDGNEIINSINLEIMLSIK